MRSHESEVQASWCGRGTRFNLFLFVCSGQFYQTTTISVFLLVLSPSFSEAPSYRLSEAQSYRQPGLGK